MGSTPTTGTDEVGLVADQAHFGCWQKSRESNPLGLALVEDVVGGGGAVQGVADAVHAQVVG